MKRLSKSKQISAMLGVSLLVLAACVPDSLTRGGGAQPIPVERGNENSAASKSTLASPLPTPAASSQNESEFTGAVEVMASDMWVVGGRTVAVTAATEIKPGLAIGTLAKVHAVHQVDGSLWAREIEPVSDDDGNSNSNDNDNDNDNSNDDNGNGNVNSNDDNGNDDDGNSNDDNGNDDDGNGNSNDDNGNADDSNENDGNGNDDDGNSNDDNGNADDSNENADDGNSNGD